MISTILSKIRHPLVANSFYLYLAHFADYPWIHLDIAGSTFVKEKYGYRGKGATGMGVRLLYQFIKNRA